MIATGLLQRYVISKLIKDLFQKTNITTLPDHPLQVLFKD